MSRSIISPKIRLDVLLGLACEYVFCLAVSAVIWKELYFGGAALLFAGLYVVRAANWLLSGICSLLSFWLTRKQRVDTLVETLRRLDMPAYTDSFRYDDAPALVSGIAQRADICEDLRTFLQSVAGELHYMRSNRQGIAYVQSLAVLNGALTQYQNGLPVSTQATDPVEERRSGRGLQAA